MNKVPLQPLGSYVVAQQEEAANKTAGGLYLPSGSQEKPKVAKVLAVGQDVREVKAGDRVVFGGYSNTEAKLGNESYLLVKEEIGRAHV